MYTFTLHPIYSSSHLLFITCGSIVYSHINLRWRYSVYKCIVYISYSYFNLHFYYSIMYTNSYTYTKSTVEILDVKIYSVACNIVYPHIKSTVEIYHINYNIYILAFYFFSATFDACCGDCCKFCANPLTILVIPPIILLRFCFIASAALSFSS